jgi:P27 family predicted phage terminase small subunit
MPGPRRTPTAILKLRGSWRAKSRANSEPTPEVAIPPRPAYLDAGARKEWDRVAAELYHAGVLTRLDMAVLAGYCQNFSRLQEAERGLAEDGLIVRSPNGYPIQNPYLSIVHEAQRQMRAFAVELGITPASRSRVTVTPKPRLTILKRQRNQK